MGKLFDDTTTPTALQVSGNFIVWSDRKVDVDGADLSLTSTDKELMSTLYSAHLISIMEDVDFRTGDVSIKSPNKPSSYLKLYESFKGQLKTQSGDAMFRTANR